MEISLVLLTALNLGLLFGNLMVHALCLKLYTEFAKERFKEER